MRKRKTDAEVVAVKDEDDQRPIPTAWRPIFCEIVKSFVHGDYRLTGGVPGVARVSKGVAKQIEEYIHDYGETLIELPDKTWKSSVCIWAGNRWDALIDLWTEEEGRSDLVLMAQVSESKTGFAFKIDMVCVP